MPDILHIITALDTGGAEIMLRDLVAHTDRREWRPTVLSLTDAGLIAQGIRDAGVAVETLGMRRGIPDPVALWRLVRLLRRRRPAIIQTWMYHSDLVGGIAARLAGRIPVVWGLHHTSLDPRGNKRSTLWTMRRCAGRSRSLPRRIVCCSQATRDIHAEQGYDAGRMVVIPNGFDTERFRPDDLARAAVRKELGLAPDTLLIGMAARFHPQKDHQNLVRAAAVLAPTHPACHFVLYGTRVDWDNAELAGWIRQAGLQDRFHLLGRRNDTARLAASLDIATLSAAYGEAFPLVIGEAMASAVPCAVTDVGDAARLVGDTGRVAPPRDPEALARAWRELIETGETARRHLGADARARIRADYTIQKIAARYQALYREVLKEDAART